MKYHELVKLAQLGNNEAIEELAQYLSERISIFISKQFPLLITKEEVINDIYYILFLATRHYDPEKSYFLAYLYRYVLRRYIEKKLYEESLIRRSFTEIRNFVSTTQTMYCNRLVNQLKELQEDQLVLEIDKVNYLHYEPKEDYSDLDEIVKNVVSIQFSKNEYYIFLEHVYEERSFVDIAKDLNISRQQVSFLYNRLIKYVKYIVENINSNQYVFLSYKKFREKRTKKK
jgi:RNA polymerase sigma factor (sigma-70 family)